MELRQLRHLIAVVEHGSFSRAAEAVHLTQPALSRSIQALESEVGAAVLERNRGAIVPTDIGHLLLTHARLLDTVTRDLERDIALTRGLELGELRIGVGPYGGSALVGPAHRPAQLCPPGPAAQDHPGPVAGTARPRPRPGCRPHRGRTQPGAADGGLCRAGSHRARHGGGVPAPAPADPDGFAHIGRRFQLPGGRAQPHPGVFQPAAGPVPREPARAAEEARPAGGGVRPVGHAQGRAAQQPRHLADAGLHGGRRKWRRGSWCACPASSWVCACASAAPGSRRARCRRWRRASWRC
jgi:hypothetical protein